jgi:hypothetical protein
MSGTSMAAPHVSGIAVLLWSKEPMLTPAEVKTRIMSTADLIPAFASKLIVPGKVNAYNALTNTIPSRETPMIGKIELTKKIMTLDGLGFVDGESVVEVNFSAVPGVEYERSYSLENGTLTRLRVKLGKKLMKASFPLGVSAPVQIFNPTTGHRSEPYYVWRR